MDFSGMGLLLVSCCLTAIIPPAVAGVLVYVILWIRLVRGSDLTREQAWLLFLIFWLLGIVAVCAWTNFAFLHIRVM